MIHARGTRTLVAYNLTSALRDRLFLSLIVLIVLAAALAIFIGDTAVVETRELATAYVSAATRVILIAGLVLFTCFNIRQSFENREVEMMLSRPISRIDYVIAYVISLVVLSAIAVLLASAAVAYVAAPSFAGLAYWSTSLFVEAVIMLIVALFFALYFTSAVAATLACFGFYALSRMIGLLTGIAEKTSDESAVLALVAWVMNAVSVVVPRLDLFGQTQWLVHGPGGEVSISLILGQGLVYVPLLTAAAIYDIQRRQF